MPLYRPRDILNQAEALEKSQRPQEASKLYSILAVYFIRQEKWDKAKILLERSIHLSPEDPKPYLFLALSLWNLKEGVTNTPSIIAMKRFSLLAYQQNKWRHYEKGVLARLPLPAVLVQAFYEILIDYERTTVEPFVKLASLYFQQAHYESAKEVLLSALNIGTPADEVVSLLQSVLEKGYPPEAVRALREYQSQSLSLVDFKNLIRGIKVKRENSEPIAPQSTRPEPLVEDLSALLSQFEKSTGLELGFKYDTAKPLIAEFKRRASSLLKDDSQSRLDLALAFLEMELYREAEDEILKVPPSDPKYPQALLLLGELHRHEENYLMSLEAYLKCLREERLEPSIRHEAKYQLVETYLKLGDLKAAWQMCLSLDQEAPSYRDLPSLKKRLSERMNDTGDPL